MRYTAQATTGSTGSQLYYGMEHFSTESNNRPGKQVWECVFVSAGSIKLGDLLGGNLEMLANYIHRKGFNLNDICYKYKCGMKTKIIINDYAFILDSKKIHEEKKPNRKLS